MVEFEYTATGRDGARRQGNLEAHDQQSARSLLLGQGLVDIELRVVGSQSAGLLTAADTSDVVQRVVDLSLSELPLVVGLRCAARESTRRPVKRALLEIAARLEGGVPLDVAMAGVARGFPRFMRGLIHAANRTGQLGPSLAELIAHDRVTSRVWWSLAGSLAYPALVCLMGCSVVGLLFLMLVPQFQSMFEDFGLQLPPLTIAMLRTSEFFLVLTTGVRKWLILSACVTLLVTVVVARVSLGGARWRRVLGATPLLGPLWSYSGATAFSRVLAVLIDCRLPLPEALQLTAAGVADHNVRAACWEYAAGVQAGSRLSQLVADSNYLPQSLAPFVQYGEEHDDLAATLREASDLYLHRLQLRATLLRSVSPSVIFALVAAVVFLCFLGLFIPLVDLIAGLA